MMRRGAEKDLDGEVDWGWGREGEGKGKKRGILTIGNLEVRDEKWGGDIR